MHLRAVHPEEDGGKCTTRLLCPTVCWAFYSSMLPGGIGMGAVWVLLVPDLSMNRADQSKSGMCVAPTGDEMLWGVPTLIYQSHRVGHCRGMWQGQVSKILEMGRSRGSDVMHQCLMSTACTPRSALPSHSVPLPYCNRRPRLFVKTGCSHLCSKRTVRAQLVTGSPSSLWKRLEHRG